MAYCISGFETGFLQNKNLIFDFYLFFVVFFALLLLFLYNSKYERPPMIEQKIYSLISFDN